MDNQTIKGILDGLTARGVLSADGRRQMFAILLQQAKEYEQKIQLLESDLVRVRESRDGLVKKNEEIFGWLPKTKQELLSS